MTKTTKNGSQTHTRTLATYKVVGTHDSPTVRPTPLASAAVGTYMAEAQVTPMSFPATRAHRTATLNIAVSLLIAISVSQ